MASSTRLRTTSAWLATALAAALVPLLGAAAPAQAADCANEQPGGLPPSACDDTTPPETSLTAMSPAPNAAGWTRTATVTFTFAAVSTDSADTDEMKLECKLEGPSQAHDWRACDSDTQQQYTGLADTTGSEAYTFRVRAYDSVDRPWDYDDPQTLLVDEEETVPDEDATPATRTWRQDTVAPAAAVYEGPYDADGTGWPITPQPQVDYLLDASEDHVAYRCLLDGREVECTKGRLLLTDLDGGQRTLTVGVTDRAGNTDDSPVVRQFVVPHNLTAAKNWSRRERSGHFADDFLQTRRFGATLKYRARLVTDIILIAPSGPSLGKIQVRVGDYRWRTIRLSRKARTQRHYVVRDEKSLFSGPVRIRSISPDKPVRVDAFVFPPS